MRPLAIALIVAALFALVSALAALGNEPRPAPDFALVGGRSLSSLRGQPVVVVVAKSPRSWRFRREIGEVSRHYVDFAARNTVFIAVFTGRPVDSSSAETSTPIRSNIPFVVVRDSGGIPEKLGLSEGFGVAVIGKDGNIDLATPKYAAAYRIRDAIVNNFEQQTSERNESL